MVSVNQYNLNNQLTDAKKQTAAPDMKSSVCYVVFEETVIHVDPGSVEAAVKTKDPFFWSVLKTPDWCVSDDGEQKGEGGRMIFRRAR